MISLLLFVAMCTVSMGAAIDINEPAAIPRPDPERDGPSVSLEDIRTLPRAAGLPPGTSCVVPYWGLLTLAVFFAGASLFFSLLLAFLVSQGKEGVSPRQKLLLVLVAVAVIASTVTVGAYYGTAASRLPPQGSSPSSGAVSRAAGFSTTQMRDSHNWFRGISGLGKVFFSLLFF